MPHEHHSSSRVLWSIIIIILVIIGALWFLSTKEGSNVTYDEQGNAITQAPEGQLATGFPKELLLEQDAVIQMSYVIAYATRGEQMPVARYESKLGFNQTVDGYRRLLIEQGFVIGKDGTIDEVPVTNFSATKDTAEVNVTITLQSAGNAFVEVAYRTPTTQ